MKEFTAKEARALNHPTTDFVDRYMDHVMTIIERRATLGGDFASIELPPNMLSAMSSKLRSLGYRVSIHEQSHLSSSRLSVFW
jgi:hypothetical protein